MNNNNRQFVKEKNDIPIQKWNKTKINLASLSILSELGL